MKKIIIEKVKQLAGNNFLYFEDVIAVKKTPHSIPVKMWAVSVSPDDVIYLMDGDQQSFSLEEGDINYYLVIASLYQRVMFIFRNKAA